ncbi:MAG: matrixin family metalloprotease [Chloroflexi bacterium]|nr:matrixin family metalloprotease [Chloroflexota bacterium]
MAAQGREVEATETRGKPVRAGVSLWVFVFPEGNANNPGKGKPSGGDSCTDTNTQEAFLLFALAKQGGMAFNLTTDSIPAYLGVGATSAINTSFDTWNAVTPYFTVSNSGGATRPAEDGNNSVGWAFLVPKTALAAAWVWVDDATGRVKEADVFFNSQHKWGVLSACKSQDVYDVQDIGTHEVGHVAALDHVSDTGKQATMYPTAAKGEVKKRTLTAGDSNGVLSAQ